VLILELTLTTSDVAAQSTFWGRTLGLPTRDEAGALEVSLRRSTIRFQQAPPGEDPRYHFALNVPPGSIAEAAAWLEERHELLAFHDDPDVPEGATIVHTDRGASALYFLDAAGNVVELIANDHLDDRFEEPFGPNSLLEVAEIGIATSDTATTSKAVQHVFSAGILWGGREGWRLTAIGDDHGVVIVAPLGRGWIPIGLQARPLPTTVVAEASRTRELVLEEGPYRFRGSPRA
jgi:catechol 2,3-dioxygenase-like lactoylglutathione lyase family enzyme